MLVVGLKSAVGIQLPCGDAINVGLGIVGHALTANIEKLAVTPLVGVYTLFVDIRFGCRSYSGSMVWVR